MKNNQRLSVLVVIVMAGVLIFAATEPLFATTKGSLKGKVTQISIPASTITVEGKTSGMTFSIIEKTLFHGYTSINDIKTGDAVTVSYLMRHGVATAKKITRIKSAAKRKS